ncbi:hypothetical protein HBB16_08915 [Pseudonocardia sp. MCCB 268]|nr:hypothetical protein [Pseudonocardia cytotoxica]
MCEGHRARRRSEEGTSMSHVDDAIRPSRAGVVLVVDDQDRGARRPHHSARVRDTDSSPYFLERTSGFCASRRRGAGRELDLGVVRTPKQGTAFLVSVDHHLQGPRPASARSRAATIRALARPGARPETSPGPGRMPLLAHAGGAGAAGHYRRRVWTCARIMTAGLSGAALLCEIDTPDRRSVSRRRPRRLPAAPVDRHHRRKLRAYTAAPPGRSGDWLAFRACSRPRSARSSVLYAPREGVRLYGARHGRP